MPRGGGQRCVRFSRISGPIPQIEERDPAVEYKSIVDQFISLGAKHFLFETFSSSNGLSELGDYIKAQVPDAFIVLSFAVQPDGYTREGHFGKELFLQMSRHESIDAVGFNCVSGAYHMLSYIKTLDHSGAVLSVMPNAGYPIVINNRTFFGSTPDYYAEQMAEIVRQGALIIGGCCGTTPAHIKATVKAVSALTADKTIIHSEATSIKQEKHISENRFWQKVQNGRRVIAVELDSPANADLSSFMEGARTLKAAGVDTVTIADCPVGRARVDSSILACKLKRELDIDPLPHMTCRDRNINATKALLLGLYVEGIQNVLVVTGDPIPSADRDEVKSVFNFNSRMLARYIKKLNETAFSTPFRIYGALNVNARNFQVQLRIAKEKIENGVSHVFYTANIYKRGGRKSENCARDAECKDSRRHYPDRQLQKCLLFE